MTATSTRTLGNVVLLLAILLLLVALAGMLGVGPRLVSMRSFVPVCLILLFAALMLRRRGAPPPD